MKEKSIQAVLIERFPALIDEATKIDIRPEWIKYVYQFCEQVEALDFDHRRMRLHDIYEAAGGIVLDYDTMPDTEQGTIPPRIKLRIRHIADETSLESKLEGKDNG
ncbi:hypothetical protein HFO32_22335 [Rhizobium leguminosarum]|uniref:hypothetical protein n=1 Tax=Rhizobium leguminosarum TaxID=384 RepID=UPI001C94B8C9|nr:hypothetical protein [Rhizobium leguminosarum]MBY5684865.1 hypothetical protein [Rhizobium leguminosarum]